MAGSGREAGLEPKSGVSGKQGCSGPLLLCVPQGGMVGTPSLD